MDLLGSREQRVVPLMTSSWLENVNKYSELEGDSAIFASQDSLEVLNWNTSDNCNGRPGSPLHFDHEELLRIDEDQVCKSLCLLQLHPKPCKASICFTFLDINHFSCLYLKQMHIH